LKGKINIIKHANLPAPAQGDLFIPMDVGLASPVSGRDHFKKTDITLIGRKVVMDWLGRDIIATIERLDSMNQDTAYTVIWTKSDNPDEDIPKGYFGHWFNNRRNPFILDLLILSPTGHYLMVDLKVSNHYQPGQKEIVAQGYGHFAWSLDDFIVILNKWEKNIRVKKLGKHE